MKQLEGDYKQLYELLPKGMEHTITAHEISKITGIPKRRIYSMINILILHYDVPVGGLRNDGKHGYFIATNREELRRAISPLEHHAGEMLKRVEHLKQIDLEA